MAGCVTAELQQREGRKEAEGQQRAGGDTLPVRQCESLPTSPKVAGSAEQKTDAAENTTRAESLHWWRPAHWLDL